MSHDERYFHDAQNFHPERWLPDSHEYWEDVYRKDFKEASKPFSLGPRACLGINLAYMEMRIILARLVWEFEWRWGKGGEGCEWDRDNQLKLLWQKPMLKVKFVSRERSEEE